MKTRLAFIFIISALTVFIMNGCSSSQYLEREEAALAEDPVSLETFEDSLSSDGQFISVTGEDEIDPDNLLPSGTGYLDEDVYTNYFWVPNENYLYEGWTPYTNGRWEWTYWGWTWVSDYNWGWATYHYGRWWYSPVYGWVWSPGRYWAPAWVNWCNNGGFVGWYPISPRIHRNHNSGISTINHHFRHEGWTVVEEKNFNKKVTQNIVIIGTKKTELLTKSNPYVKLEREGNKLVNSGPNIKEIEKAVNKNIEQKSLTEVIENNNPVFGVSNTHTTLADENNKNSTKSIKSTNTVTNNNSNTKSEPKNNTKTEPQPNIKSNSNNNSTTNTNNNSNTKSEPKNSNTKTEPPPNVKENNNTPTNNNSNTKSEPNKKTEPPPNVRENNNNTPNTNSNSNTTPNNNTNRQTNSNQNNTIKSVNTNKITIINNVKSPNKTETYQNPVTSPLKINPVQKVNTGTTEKPVQKTTTKSGK
jgi:hypothetical protein